MKRLLILPFILQFICASGQEKKYDLIADSLSRAGQKEKLIPYFHAELKSHPRDENVLRWLGYLYIMSGQLDSGEIYYRKAIALNPKCTKCYLNLGQIYWKKKDNKKALEFYNQAVSIDPKDARLYSERAVFKENSGDKFGALSDYDKAIGMDQKNADFYMQRGIYNANLGYTSIALPDMNKAVELAPHNYIIYFKRAGIYFSQQMYREALEDMNAAIQLDSTPSASLYNGRGSVYAATKEHDMAIADYTMAIQLNPADYLPYYNRALEKYAKEDMDGSCEDMLESHSTLKKYEPENEFRLELEYSIGNYCDSGRPSYYYQRGIAFYNLGQFAKAVGIYTRGLNKFPVNSMLLSFRGNAYFALKNYEKALPDYYASIQNQQNIIYDIKANRKPDELTDASVETYAKGFIASMHISIAEAKFALGKFDEALGEINKGIDKAPPLKDFGKEHYYHVRGIIFLALGKNGEALADFDKCIQLNPAYTMAYINRAIARINRAGNKRVSSYFIRTETNNQVFHVNWTIPLKASAKKEEPGISSALDDCNKALELDPESAYAWYIRGRIKKMMEVPDYCYDLLKAHTLGYLMETALLRDCVK